MNARDMIYAAAVKAGLATRNPDGSVDIDAGQFIQFLVMLNRKYALIWKEDVWTNQKIVSRSVTATAQIVPLPQEIDQVQTARIIGQGSVSNFREIDDIGLSRFSPGSFLPASSPVEIAGYIRISDASGCRRLQIMPAPHASQYPIAIELTAIARFVPLGETEEPLFAEDALFSYLVAEMYMQTGEIDLSSVAQKQASTALQIEKDREKLLADREFPVAVPMYGRDWSGD